MSFLEPTLIDYLSTHSEQESPLLRQLNRETHLKVLRPRMLCGHHQGRFLSLVSKILGPRNILEIGTFTGYSTLCLAEGMRKDGFLHTIEIDEELFDIQDKYFQKSNYRDRIIQHLGNALDILPTLDKNFDLIFLDADKENYLNYYPLLVKKLNPKGVLLSDNVLWNGKVLHPSKGSDKATATLKEFNKKINSDTNFETVMLPIRDGISLSRKREV